MTSRAMSLSEKPSALPQFRHAEFSNVRRWPQLGQWKSRMQLIAFVGYDVDSDVDHALLGVGVDDPAQRWDVGVVTAAPDDDVALVDYLVIGGVDPQQLDTPQP